MTNLRTFYIDSTLLRIFLSSPIVTPILHQKGKYIPINIVAVDKKRTIALSLECIHKRNTKISIPLEHIQFKVISYIRSNKNTS